MPPKEMKPKGLKVKALNPRALIKADQKKKAENATRAALAAEAKPTAPAPPAERAVAEVGPGSEVVRPVYLRKEREIIRRMRSCAVPRKLQERLEVEPAACNDAFIRELLKLREEQTKDCTVKVARFDGHDTRRMNMDEETATACIQMMECYDYTYGALTSVRDVLENAASLTCLEALESIDGRHVVSHCFCLVYQLFLLRLSKSKSKQILREAVNAQAKAVALIFLRYTLSAKDFIARAAPLLVDNKTMVLVDAHEEGSKKMPICDFVDKLVRVQDHPDFLEATFPPYTQEERRYLELMIPFLRQQEKAVAAQRDAEAKRRAEMTPDEVQEEKRQKVEARRKLREENVALERKCRNSALLPGFSDMGTQINWVNALFERQRQNQAALREEMERRQALIEREKAEAAAKEEAEAAAAAEAAPQPLDELELGGKRSGGAAVGAPKKKKKKKQAGGPAEPAVAAEGSRLEEEADAYLGDF